MPIRHDLHEFLALTALGVVLGLAHLALRPGLPVVAEPAAACTLDEPTAAPEEPLSSTPPEPMSSMLPEATP